MNPKSFCLTFGVHFRAPRPFLSMTRSCLVLDKPKVLTRKKTSKAEKKCEKKRKILSIHKKCLNLHQN